MRVVMSSEVIACALVFFKFKIHHFFSNSRSERMYCWLFIAYVINLDIYQFFSNWLELLKVFIGSVLPNSLHKKRGGFRLVLRINR
jgi:hypothetical protein